MMIVKADNRVFPRFLTIMALCKNVSSDKWYALRAGKAVEVNKADGELMVDHGWVYEVEENEPEIIQEGTDDV